MFEKVISISEMLHKFPSHYEYDIATQPWYDWGYELADSEALGAAYTALFDKELSEGEEPQFAAEGALIALGIWDHADGLIE